MAAVPARQGRLYLASAILLGLALLGYVIWSATREDELSDARVNETTAGDAGTSASAIATPDGGAVIAVPDDAGVPFPSELAPVRLSDVAVERDGSLAAGALEGRVVAFASGRGVPSAELSFEHGGRTVSVRAGEDGAFTFAPPEEGTYVLAVATAEGFLPFAPEWGHSPIRFEARRGVRLSGVLITLVDALEHVAIVTNGDGERVPGAEVRVLGAEQGERALAPIASRFRTDARGEARFVAPDGAVLEASHPAHGRGRASLDGSAQVSHRIAIRLSREAEHAGDLRISGRVLGGGAPIEGALVTARDTLLPSAPEAALHPTLEATTDADGRFVLEGADALEYRVDAHAEGWAHGTALSAAGAADVTLVLVRESPLRVRVRDGAGQPIAAATVVVTRSTGPLTQETLAVESAYDERGEIVIGGLAPGPVSVLAVAPGYAPSPSTAARAPGDVEVRLDRGGTITGRVVSRDAAPLEGARVTLEGLLGRGPSAVPLEASTLSGAGGSFSLSGVPPGIRSIAVWAGDHHGRLRSGIEVASGAEIDVGVIDLAPLAEGEQPQLEMAGIGAVLSAEGDAMVIGRVVEGGGAAEVGLVPGDAILEVDATPVVTLGFEGTIQRIRGPEGTWIRLRVRREGGREQVIVVPRRRMRA
jgi:hypothetical protein